MSSSISAPCRFNMQCALWDCKRVKEEDSDYCSFDHLSHALLAEDHTYANVVIDGCQEWEHDIIGKTCVENLYLGINCGIPRLAPDVLLKSPAHSPAVFNRELLENEAKRLWLFKSEANLPPDFGLTWIQDRTGTLPDTNISKRVWNIKKKFNLQLYKLFQYSKPHFAEAVFCVSYKPKVAGVPEAPEPAEPTPKKRKKNPENNEPSLQKNLPTVTDSSGGGASGSVAGENVSHDVPVQSVFDGVEIDQAMEWTMFGCFWTNGQICSVTPRILAHGRLTLNERMVSLLPAAGFSLCTGFITSLPFPKEHHPTPSEWALCEVVKVDDGELEIKLGLFECSPEVLTRVCSNYNKISSCRVPDGVQLPLVLRETLLHNMEIYFLSFTPEYSEKGPLSDIFMRCALLCPFMNGSYMARTVKGSSSFFLKSCQYILESLDYAVEGVLQSLTDFQRLGPLRFGSEFNEKSSIIVLLRPLTTSPVFSNSRDQNLLATSYDDVFRYLDNLLRSFAKVYEEYTENASNAQSDIVLSKSLALDSPEVGRIVDLDLALDEDSKEIDLVNAEADPKASGSKSSSQLVNLLHKLVLEEDTRGILSTERGQKALSSIGSCERSLIEYRAGNWDFSCQEQ